MVRTKIDSEALCSKGENSFLFPVWSLSPQKLMKGKTGERSSPLHGGSKPPPYNVPGILNEQGFIINVCTKEPSPAGEGDGKEKRISVVMRDPFTIYCKG